MGTDVIVDRLVRTGLLEARDGGETVAVSDRFEDEWTTYCERVDSCTETELDEMLRDAFGANRITLLGTLANTYPDFVARCLVLAEHGPDLAFEELLTTAIVVEQLQDSFPPVAGVPEAFLPVRGDQLLELAPLFERAIVYVWRDDCDPCDVMRAEFDDIFEEPPDDVMLFAVYGPDNVQILRNEFDVVGGPATLFLAAGEVDARLNGPHYRDVIEDEIDVLRELPTA